MLIWENEANGVSDEERESVTYFTDYFVSPPSFRHNDHLTKAVAKILQYGHCREADGDHFPHPHRDKQATRKSHKKRATRNTTRAGSQSKLITSAGVSHDFDSFHRRTSNFECPKYMDFVCVREDR